MRSTSVSAEKAASPAFYSVRQRLTLVLLFAGISAVHFLTAWLPGPAPNVEGKTSEYYPLLTDTFLAGRTSLLVEPDPRLLALPDPRNPAANQPYRLHDASLYKGKYYLYFGPVPVLVLFLPYKLLTGSHLPTRAAVALFSIIGYASSCALLFVLIRRLKWLCPFWLAAAAVTSLGTSSLVYFLVRRASFYEAAIASAYCMTAAGFLALAHGLKPSSPSWTGLLFSGVCFGLTAGCRPSFALVAAFMAVAVSLRLIANKTRALVFAIPVVICGAVLAWYNYARFDNPLDFGVRYQLSSSKADVEAHYGRGIGPIFPALYELLLGAPVTDIHYDPKMGLLRAAPIALLGICAPLFLWRYRTWLIDGHSTAFIAWCLYATAAGMLALLAAMDFVIGRYQVDFAPEFALLAWLVLCGIWTEVRTWPGIRLRLIQATAVIATLYSAFIDLGGSLSRIRG